MNNVRGAVAFVLTLILAAPASADVTIDQVAGALADAKATMLIDTAMARRKAQHAEKMTLEIDNKARRETALANAKWLQGEASLRLNEIDQAATFASSAVRLTRSAKLDPKLVSDITLLSAGVKQAEGDVAGSLADYQSAFRGFQALHDARDQARALLSIASLYGEANDYRNSLKYLDQALDVYHADPSLLLSIYNDRASNLQDLGDYARSEAEYIRALDLAKQMNSALLSARFLGNIARVRLKAGNYNGAERALADGFALTHSGEAANWRPQLLAIAAQLALQQNDPARARAYIVERFKGVDLATTTMPYREAHDTAYRTFTALGEDGPALAHLAALKRLDDQATKLATSANIALSGARFDFTNQKLKITALENEQLQRNVAFEQARARTQRTVFLGAALATAVVIAILAFALVTIRRSRDKVRAAASDLAVTNTALGKALAAKTEFLATTSHEIRTPLNGILGMTQVMLADPRIGGDTRDRLGVVHGAGVTMRALVDDILDVAKMETGNLTIEQAPFDLRATLVDATRMWDEQARAKGLTFVVEAQDAPRRILGDAARVRQIAFNLLSNAVKFTAAGAVTLRILADGDHYHVIVKDSGIGIAADKREEIFESFRQADAGTTRQFGGTGLGLSICRNLARAMQGDVTVDSDIGRGATFTVTLPLIAAPAEESCVAAAGDDPRPAVLILDRNPITRAMLKSLVAPRASAVAVAGDVDAARQCLAKGGIDLVVIDDGAVRGEDADTAIAQLAEACAREGATATLLWAGDASAATHAMPSLRILPKPIKGTELLAALFADPLVQPALETHAA